MARILIVEDDADLAAVLDDCLRHEGYATGLAGTGVEALDLLSRGQYDVMLLDRDLPVLSGDEVMRTVDRLRLPVRTLMLTAAGGVEDRVQGLDLGADDYLPKPFAYPELLARIRALLRRGDTDDAPTMLSRGRRDRPCCDRPERSGMHLRQARLPGDLRLRHRVARPHSPGPESARGHPGRSRCEARRSSGYAGEPAESS